MRGLSLAALPLVATAQASWDATLHLLPSDLVTSYGAVCLDGSAPGIYYRPASNPSSNTKWKFHFQGGGWCTSASDCYSRSQQILGSSSTWPQQLSTFWAPEYAGFYGLMDCNSTNGNPSADWNFVWVAYCDGSSYTSNRDFDQPIVYNNAKLYMRGRAILDAHLAYLERSYSFLSQATEVIISGTSAGGLATYLQSSYIKSRLTLPGARLVAMPDAGFFLDHVQWSDGKTHAWYNTISAAVQPSLWNATLRGAGARCLAQQTPLGTAPKCYFAQYIYPYITDVDGIFVLQSLYDTAQLGICYGFPCNLYTSCNATQVDQAVAYSEDLRSNLTSVQALFPTRDGGFFTSCYQHEESCRARDWYGITIKTSNGVAATANTTFWDWYSNGPSGNGDTTVVDVPWPGDNSCAPQDFTHGAC